MPLVAPLRPIAAVTRGHGITQLYQVLGGAPAPLVKRGYQLAGIDKYVMKPWTVASNLGDRDLLAQIEAVDVFMDRMHAYPGRTFGQLYHRFFRTNDLADGRLALTDTTIDLADVRIPLLAIAGRGDGIAPVAACHHVADLVPDAPVELETAPGGHLGVLTGRKARDTTWKRLDAFLDARRLAARAARPEVTLGAMRPLIAAVVVLLLLPAGAAAQDDPVLPPGARAAGIDLGGQTVSQAAATLDAAFAAALAQPIEFRVAGHRKRLDPASIGFGFDPLRSARRAYDAAIAAGGPVDVPLHVTYDGEKLAAFTVALDRASDIRPRSAKLKMTIRRMKVRRARMGWSIDEKALALSLDPLLADPWAAPRRARGARAGAPEASTSSTCAASTGRC